MQTVSDAFANMKRVFDSWVNHAEPESALRSAMIAYSDSVHRKLLEMDVQIAAMHARIAELEAVLK